MDRRTEGVRLNAAQLAILRGVDRLRSEGQTVKFLVIKGRSTGLWTVVDVLRKMWNDAVDSSDSGG